MKTISKLLKLLAGYFAILLICTGCASQMINEEGTDWSWYGRVVDWAKDWHGSDVEVIDEN